MKLPRLHSRTRPWVTSFSSPVSSQRSFHLPLSSVILTMPSALTKLRRQLFSHWHQPNFTRRFAKLLRRDSVTSSLNKRSSHVWAPPFQKHPCWEMFAALLVFSLSLKTTSSITTRSKLLPTWTRKPKNKLRLSERRNLLRPFNWLKTI